MKKILNAYVQVTSPEILIPWFLEEVWAPYLKSTRCSSQWAPETFVLGRSSRGGCSHRSFHSVSQCPVCVLIPAEVSSPQRAAWVVDHLVGFSSQHRAYVASTSTQHAALPWPLVVVCLAVPLSPLVGKQHGSLGSRVQQRPRVQVVI